MALLRAVKAVLPFGGSVKVGVRLAKRNEESSDTRKVRHELAVVPDEPKEGEHVRGTAWLRVVALHLAGSV